MRRLIREGSIGDVFQYDSFVGGYSRPCDYWYSDADVAGGAIFDWGSHYLDQVLNIFDAPIEHVSGMNHKRKWLHATNADHAEVIVTFNDGRQATFVHSDLAAARGPSTTSSAPRARSSVSGMPPPSSPSPTCPPASSCSTTPVPAARSTRRGDSLHLPRRTCGLPHRRNTYAGRPAAIRNVVSVMEAAGESATNPDGRSPHLADRSPASWGQVDRSNSDRPSTRDAPSAHLAAVAARTFSKPRAGSRLLGLQGPD